MIAVHEALLATVKPAAVIGVALNTRGLSEAQAREEIERARRETGLPADDVVRFGARNFYAAIAPQVAKRAPLRTPRHRVTRAFARLVAVALLALLAFNACASRSQKASRFEHNAWTIPGVLRLGEAEEPDSLNLMYAHSAAADEISGLLFTFVLRYDRDGNYVPDLATAVPTVGNGGIAKDGRTIVVHLRKGVVWADGVALTARDWIFTYRAATNRAQ